MIRTNLRDALGDVIEEHGAAWRQLVDEHRRLVAELQVLLDQSTALLTKTHESACRCIAMSRRRDQFFTGGALTAMARQCGMTSLIPAVESIPGRMRRPA